MFINHQQILPQGVLPQGVMSLNAKWLVYSKRKKERKFGAGMAQWLEHSPPTNVPRVRFPDPASYVG